MLKEIYEIINEYLRKFFSSRVVVLCCLYVVMLGVLFVRLYRLQLVDGEKYVTEYVNKAEKVISIPATRGNIYDVNGNLLAYNKLIYSVEIQDNGEYKTVEERNLMLYKLLKILNANGEEIIGNLKIGLNNDGSYYYTTNNEEARKRFLKEFYGLARVDELDDPQGRYPSNVSADELMSKRITSYKFDKLANDEGELIELTPKEKLDLVDLRFSMSFTAYRKYEATLIATDISEQTKTQIKENSSELLGVNVKEDTLRQYNDSIYFSSIIGYTGKIQGDQLEELKKEKPNINENYTIGKIGIEKYMEDELHGIDGTQTIYVDNVGHIRQVISETKPKSGANLYLTIDRKLQIGIYHQLEQELAGILSNKLSPLDDPNESNTDSTDRRIPIKDAYFQLINNNVLSLERLSSDEASQNERNIYSKYTAYKEASLEAVKNELMAANPQVINALGQDQQAFMFYIFKKLTDLGIVNAELMDKNKNEDYYVRWKANEISLRELLYQGISSNWIDTTSLNIDTKYSDADDIFTNLVNYILEYLKTDVDFEKQTYKYMILGNIISGNELCIALYNQGILEDEPEEINALSSSGSEYAFSFMVRKISTLKITPAQLALDPCTAGAVVTDVNTGEVRALVSYPGYDGNKLSNVMDANYYNKLLNDKSLPLYNNATQTRKAPGSTFKPISAIAGLEEMVVSNSELIDCTGEYDTISPTIKCWIYPGRHNKLNVETAIQNSCNYYFAELAHRLSTKENGEYSTSLGTEKLKKYASLFGLEEKSGVEIEENEPSISDVSPEQSAMGQGNHQYANVQLSRYVAALANQGKVFKLSVLDKLVDTDGNVKKDYVPEVSSEIKIADTTWNSVRTGMRGVIEHGSAGRIFKDLEVNIAGKTGTAQETNSRANHAFFISFGPYENPQIAVTVNIPFGYSSSNAATAAKDIYRLYFGYTDLDTVLNRNAVNITNFKIGD